MRLSGWTGFYLGLGAAFAYFGGEPGMIAAIFWWFIAVLNEIVDRTL